jgi:hypothetical protein
MKTRLHFGLLVILLAFLGTYLEQTTHPNQQIVIQFSDKDIAKEDAESAIAIVKAQLQDLGAELIRVNQNEDGQLRITYFSTSHVEHIQRLLLEAHAFKFTYDLEHKSTTDFPEDKSIKDYELNISEIQNGNDTNWDFERTEIVQLNQKSDYSYNPRVNASGHHINFKYSNSIIKVASQVNRAVTITIGNQSYKIPEVRAGPTLKGII